MDAASFKFACPHCGQHLEAESEWSGMEVECPTCGKAITVPPPEKANTTKRNDKLLDTSLSPIIQTVAKGREPLPPPIITVVKTRNNFFVRNRKWLVPAIGAVAVFLLVGGVWMAKVQSKKHRPRRGTASSSGVQNPTYSSPTYVTPRRSRQFVKDHIRKNDNCRIVAITKTGGDIVICGNNNWAASGCSKSITDTLQDIADEDERIVDVCLTELGRFIVLYGRNAGKWNNIPTDMELVLRAYNANNEEIYSATLNDAGDWIVVTSEHYACSATWLKEWLAGGARKYGILRAAAVSTDAAVACYDGGYLFFGNVPQNLKDALRKANFDVRIIKIAGSAWFFASNYGYNYQAEM